MTTLDPAELSHFQRLSATWWDEAGPFQLLHTLTPLRMAFLRKHAGSLEGLRVLDVGCGGGLLCEPLARLDAEVVGIDPVEENLQVARAHAEAMGLSPTYLPYAIEDLPKEMGNFDLIIASEIIEHVADAQAFLRACTARLQEGGALLVTTLNKTIPSYVLGILAAEYLFKWAPVGTHTWHKFISPPVLAENLKNLGFSTQYIQGVRLAPFSKAWHFSASTAINYFLWAQKNSVTFPKS